VTLVCVCFPPPHANTHSQLAGVALVAVQGGLGEASALALCALHPSQLALTAWSSGTGLAGVVGYAWIALLHHALGLSFTATLLAALVLPVLWLLVFNRLTRQQHSIRGSTGSAQAYSRVPSTPAGVIEHMPLCVRLHQWLLRAAAGVTGASE
jgi:battenin